MTFGDFSSNNCKVHSRR